MWRKRGEKPCRQTNCSNSAKRCAWSLKWGEAGLPLSPPAVIAKLNKVINDSIKDDEVIKRMTAVGVVVKGGTPDEFGKFLSSEYTRWDKVREAAGIPQQ